MFWAPDLPEHVKHHLSLVDPVLYVSLCPSGGVYNTTQLCECFHLFQGLVLWWWSCLIWSECSWPVSLLCWVSDQVLQQLVRVCSFSSAFVIVCVRGEPRHLWSQGRPAAPTLSTGSHFYSPQLFPSGSSLLPGGTGMVTVDIPAWHLLY